MVTIQTFRVVPNLPEKLAPLNKIAYNLWWVWNFEAIELFRRLDVDLWRDIHHNPVKALGSVSQKVLDDAAEDESFLAHMKRVEEELDWHLSKKSWFEDTKKECLDACFAYFSAEFGIHESFPVYSGGLGVLAGDHLKSASELGIPLVGIGLLYRLGYFRQYLSHDGWQLERFPELDFHNLPVTQVTNDKGSPMKVMVEYPGRNVYAQVWRANVGRVRLFLLDTNIDENSVEDRAITDQLYGGDLVMRLKQEMMLGIGGVRALRELNIPVTVYHMNEGHAAFLSLERIANAMSEHSLGFNEALELVMSGNVFTTHTPVPAGNDRFTPEMIEEYLSGYYKKFGISREQFLGLGREDPEDKKEQFCVTVLAIKTAAGCNGVSKLHGKVSRAMWKKIWPSLPTHEIPIEHITNGIQTLSWTSDEMMRLLNRYLGPRWIDNPADTTIWQNIDKIPDSELWRCRERLRETLVVFTRRKLREQLLARGASPKEAEKANSVFDPEALTIGFSRRFATYKRATLILRDINRLYEMLYEKDRPMQIIFAGKAHPQDNMGKELIRQIIKITNDDRFRSKIVFIEDYDINIARYLVQGVDVWLNNPIRPKEASGTSGMKVIPNGGLNISILDGWWDEAYNSKNGWAIGRGEEYSDLSYQDDVESFYLYNVIEKDVKSSFYNRGTDDIPREWLAMVRESMKTINSFFNTNRMVRDYTEKFYIQAHRNTKLFSAENFESARRLHEWKERIKSKWGGVAIRNVSIDKSTQITVGSRIAVRADVFLGELAPDDVLVELYFGSRSIKSDVFDGVPLPMDNVGGDGKGTYHYEGRMLCLEAGEFVYTARVLPHNGLMQRKFDPDLAITWA